MSYASPTPSALQKGDKNGTRKEGRGEHCWRTALETVPRGNYALVKVAGMLELVFKFLCNQKHPVYGSHKPIMLSIRKDYILKKVLAVHCCAYLSSEHLRKPRPVRATRVKPCLKVPKPKQNQTPQNMPKTILTQVTLDILYSVGGYACEGYLLWAFGYVCSRGER